MKKTKKKSNSIAHPSHGEQLLRLKKIKGQIEGIEKMIEQKRYCVDILTQIKASYSALKSVERQVLTLHFKSCIKSAFNSEADIDEKINEIISLI